MKDAMLIIRTVENWYDVAAVWLGFKNTAILRYRNGLKMPYEKGKMWDHIRLAHAILNRINIQLLGYEKMRFSVDNAIFETQLDNYGFQFLNYLTNLSSSGCKFLNEETITLPNHLKFKYPCKDGSSLCHIYETFFEETYGSLDVKNRTVVDVGSSIGDTPIYFALRGALKVYAYEPVREIFSYLLENIKLNKVEDKVLPLNVAVASKRGKLYLRPIHRWYGASCVSRTRNEQGYLINAEPLPLDADILKMDCEGCEYDVLLNIDPASLKFEEIMCEFHHDYRPLIKILARAGYSVKVTKGRNNNWGFLYANLKK